MRDVVLEVEGLVDDFVGIHFGLAALARLLHGETLFFLQVEFLLLFLQEHLGLALVENQQLRVKSVDVGSRLLAAELSEGFALLSRLLSFLLAVVEGANLRLIASGPL